MHHSLSHAVCLLLTLLSACAGVQQVTPRAAKSQARAERSATGEVNVFARSFLTSGGWACAIDSQRDLYCWLLTNETSPLDFVDRRPTMSLVPGLGPIEALDGKDGYVCALGSLGAVHCWGCLLGGQACSLWPEQIALPEVARSIAVGVDGACARVASGSVWCWGASAPSKVGELHDVAEISATALGRCARQHDGAVFCWGDGTAAPTPVRIEKLARAHVIASNRSYSCAITGSQRQVQCWGLPEPKRTAWESTHARSLASLQAVSTLEELRDVRQIELGERFGVAVTDSGSLYHWGATHPGDIYAFDGESPPHERPSYAGNLEPRYDAARMEDLDLEAVRIGDGLQVKRALVTGYYVCLELESGGLRCDPSLERAPFRIEEIWPEVSFGAGDAS